MQCFPLYSLLLALGNPTVNLFVLDIEGFELAVLESIPWDKVDIEVLDVETDLAGLVQKGSDNFNFLVQLIFIFLKIHSLPTLTF